MLDVATLLERCRSGDSLAWEALVRRYQARVYSVAVHYMRARLSTPFLRLKKKYTGKQFTTAFYKLSAQKRKQEKSM